MKTKSKSKDSITNSTSNTTRETTTQASVPLEVNLAQSFERRINKLEQRIERLELEKKKVQQCYAVVVGQVSGVYQSWPEANAQVDKFPGQIHCGKFKSSEDANQWFDRERTRYEKCIHTNARYLPDYSYTTYTIWRSPDGRKHTIREHGCEQSTNTVIYTITRMYGSKHNKRIDIP